jgi:hypothetical protein
MWDAMLHLKVAYPDRVKSLDYFTFASEERYISSDEPKLLALLPYSHRHKKNDSKWLYIPPKNQPRGILVARMIVDEMNVHIIELQRRPTKASQNSKQEKPGGQLSSHQAESADRKSATDITKPGEESFLGIIALPNTLEEFEEWLISFLRNVIETQKITSALISEFPGSASTFTHHSMADQDYLCQRPLKRALRKLKIDF